jgi:hypothetical protein
VVPASRLRKTRWIDPAGFELDVSADPLDELRFETVGVGIGAVGIPPFIISCIPSSITGLNSRQCWTTNRA